MSRLALRAAVAAFALAVVVAAAPAVAGEHRFGVGVHYWKTAEDFEDLGLSSLDDFEDDGVSEVFSYQYLPQPLFRVEVDVEYFDDGLGFTGASAWTPQVYLLVGRGLYAGIGAGATYSEVLDGSWSDPYWAGRAGFEMRLLPHILLDLTAHYRFDAVSDLENVETDVLTFGVMLRFSL